MRKETNDTVDSLNNSTPRKTENEIIDQPEELCFAQKPESDGERRKRIHINELINNNEINYEVLLELARSEYGLVNDKIRAILWPRLAKVNEEDVKKAPNISELQSHPEYQQVVLDVNRSLKRFPPGIPYQQRIALQDQLTVLILRVINKYPNLRYYQGYHDVAVTFLLVVGEDLAFAVMEKLSTYHFEECMQETMDATQKRLMFIWPLLKMEHPTLYKFMVESSVGTLFALPWYLTWFGHSLNSYLDVVRLYDYFLASPIYTPIYVTVAIVLYRADEILAEQCDMPSIHCLLSKLPDDLPFEELLVKATNLYQKYDIDLIEQLVEDFVKEEQERRLLEQKEMMARRNQIPMSRITTATYIKKYWLPRVMTPKRVIVTTAFSIIIGFCAYYYRSHYLSPGFS
ncbi:TBC1 domain family member 20 [Teleopsis dalmanni]|uniref:TBC1 domain family member 20 n=1 Tax=Teleopsis dalmanni TaxID=139649 RepID=UPI0018CCE851|nr:TBC1 domain family member 20 [Teleopsis dalmanni]